MAAAKVGILGQAAPGAATNNDIYTVPSGRRSVGSTLIICNTNTTPTKYRVYARINGAAAAVGNAIAYDIDIDSNGRHSYTEGLAVDDADVITVRSTDGGVTFTLMGTEEDNV